MKNKDNLKTEDIHENEGDIKRKVDSKEEDNLKKKTNIRNISKQL